MVLLAATWLGAAGGCARVDTVMGAGGATGTSPDAASEAGGIDVAAADRPSDAPSDTPATPTACVNLECQRAPCTGAPRTSLSGTVFAPNGTLPLYNVRVYIPNAPLDPLPVGVSCDRCGTPASGKPIVTTLSNAEGTFRLTDVPAGRDIPLVVQVGKWRRKVTLPVVTACQDNAITDTNLTRLPRNRQEGDMPRVAVTTGDCDQLGCLLPKLGIDSAELGIPGQDKAITYFSGTLGRGAAGVNIGPPNMPPSTRLWSDDAELAKHDMAVLSCECEENLGTKSPASFVSVGKYLDKGGRIFGTHYSYVWELNDPDPAFQAAVPIGTNPPGVADQQMTVDITFPKGKALADWMKFVDPAVTYAEITANTVYNNVGPVMPPSARAWASSPTIFLGAPDAGSMMSLRPRIVTVNTPVGLPADQQCGRAAHLDAHITDPGAMMAGLPFPESCGPTLTKGEEALAFLFFDLSSCIQDDSMPPIQ